MNVFYDWNNGLYIYSNANHFIIAFTYTGVTMFGNITTSTLSKYTGYCSIGLISSTSNTPSLSACIYTISNTTSNTLGTSTMTFTPTGVNSLNGK